MKPTRGWRSSRLVRRQIVSVGPTSTEAGLSSLTGLRHRILSLTDGVSHHPASHPQDGIPPCTPFSSMVVSLAISAHAYIDITRILAEARGGATC